MKRTFELEHNGKESYHLNGEELICDSAINQNKTKAFQVSLEVSDGIIAGANTILVKKVQDGWNWPGSNMKYPLIIYKGGADFLNELFPDAQPEQTYSIWIKTTIKKQKKD